jgi:hypothetical protein
MASLLSDFIKDYSSKGLRDVDDSRKPVITLRHLNKLKKMEAIRKLEKVRREALLKVMYGGGGGEEGGLQ